MHVIVNIIKFKRMQGLNYLSFGEQSFFFIMLILHVWFPSDGEGGREGRREEGGGGREGEREGGREGEKEGGILCCPFSQQYPAEKL